MRKQLKEFTLLYAEDEPEVRAQMVENFESYFKTVFIASDGYETLKLYEENRPDVLILDINMPKLNGLEVAKSIRKTDSITKLIMLTAHSEKDLLLQATEINMSKYLIKPVSPYDLKDALDKVASELLTHSKKIIKLDENTTFSITNETLSFNSEIVPLLPKERKLLSLLISKRGDCVSFEDIMANVWEEHFDEEISKDSVKTQVTYLRKKVPKNCIESVYGKGYCLKEL